MSKKLTYEYVKGKFEKEGYELLSKDYLHAHSKLKYVCNNGHIHNISYDKFKQGKRCPYCARVAKPSIQEIYNVFTASGYTLLSKEYINNNTKLYFICPNGHKHCISWAAFRRGQRCGRCKGNVEVTYEQVKEAFEQEEYVLFSKNYVNSKSKLVYSCPFGHEGFITWDNFKYGYRCPICFAISMLGENNPNWKGGYHKKDYCLEWLDQEYKTSIRKRDKFICQNPYCYKATTILNIHHIDYDKKNCHPSNLITVCASCNALANSKRKWHTEWYQILMNKKFGYKY